MDEIRDFRLNKAYKQNFHTGEFNWEEIYFVLNEHLGMFSCNLYLMKTPIHRQQLKNYLQDNGLYLQALIIEHKAVWALQQPELLASLESIIEKYKLLLAFL
jgi:hypothetical protein